MIAKKFEKELDEVEPWYGTKYKKINISEDILQDWRQAGLCNELKIPPKNEFIPTDFDLYPIDNDVSLRNLLVHCRKINMCFR